MTRFLAIAMTLVLSGCLPFGAKKTQSNKTDSIYTGIIMTAVGGGLTFAGSDTETDECRAACKVGVPIALIGVLAIILAANWTVTD